MSNLYKSRNFSPRVEISPVIVEDENALIASNSLYDKSKGLTHYFLHTNKGKEDDNVRLICDVEIAMSNSEAVTSEFSPEYRQKLAMGLASAKGSGPTGLTDEQLMDSVPCNVQLERDEISAFSRSQLDTLEASVRSSKRLSETPKDFPAETPKDVPAENPPASV